MEAKMKKSYLMEGINKLHIKASSFARQIAPFYEQLNWLWSGEDKPPNKDKIMETIEELLDSLMENYESFEESSVYRSTGGLTVGYEEYDTYIEFFIGFTHDIYASVDKESEDWEID